MLFYLDLFLSLNIFISALLVIAYNASKLIEIRILEVISSYIIFYTVKHFLVFMIFPKQRLACVDYSIRLIESTRLWSIPF